MSRNKDDFREWLRKFIRKLQKLRRDIAKTEWILVDLQNSVREQVELQQSLKRTNSRKSCRTSRPRTAAARRSNARYVKEGVTHLVIEHDADGRMKVHIENFVLAVDLKTSQRLRQVMLVLCIKVSRFNDPEFGVVPYKTSGELREAIEEISGKPMSITNLQNHIQVLRDRFQMARIDPKLVETGGGGYRFRLQLDGDVHEER